MMLRVLPDEVANALEIDARSSVVIDEVLDVFKLALASTASSRIVLTALDSRSRNRFWRVR